MTQVKTTIIDKMAQQIAKHPRWFAFRLSLAKLLIKLVVYLVTKLSGFRLSMNMDVQETSPQRETLNYPIPVHKPTMNKHDMVNALIVKH